MASPGGPEEEFRDERRKRLLSDLEQLVGLTVPPTTWACLWLADIKALEDWLESCRQDKFPGASRQLLLNYDKIFHVFAKWKQTDRPSCNSRNSLTPTSGLTTPQPPSSPQLSTSSTVTLKRKRENRSEKVRSLCEKRDQSRCIITRDFTHDVAHIYPFSLRDHRLTESPSDGNIWQALQYFWSKDRVEAWHKAIFPHGTEVWHNQMCLSPSAHRYHRKGYFALKPISISDDQKCLTVRFFWLLKGSDQPFVNICRAPSLEGYDQGPGYARLFNHETMDPVRSGDEIHFKTEDPVDHPLPSWELLEMQWFLNRILAISGAADVEDDYDDDDDDDDDEIVLEQEEDLDMLNASDSEEEK